MIYNTIYAVSGLRMAVPEHARAIHKELVHRAGGVGNRRTELEGRLSVVIHQLKLWDWDLNARGLQPSPRELADQFVRQMIDYGAVRRRPFRVDEALADAWLASVLVMMEPG